MKPPSEVWGTSPAGEPVARPRTAQAWTANKPLRRTLAIFALICGIAASLLAGWQVKRATEEEARAKFEGVCEELTTRIRERFTAYALMLQGGQGLMAASQMVDRAEWRAYLETLRAEQTVPGYQAVGFTLLVPHEAIAKHVATVRAEGFADYAVSPAGQRPSYAPVVFIEPFAGRNMRAFGFDMFAEPARREAMERARDTGHASVTGKISLIQEDTDTPHPGFLMYVPVYRNGAPTGTIEERREALVGWIFGAFRMTDLMAGIVPDWLLLGHRFLDMHIYDGDAPIEENFLFDSRPGAIPHGARSFLNEERTIELGGRHWLLVYNGSAAADEVSYAPAWITTGAGIIISGLLFGLILLSYKRADAQRIAEKYAEQVRGMAFHDSLTRLPNRLLLRDRLEMALAAGKRSGKPGALMMIDLDNFKPLNDSQGHEAGDRLLVEVARRIRSCVRETDTVARIGGDEFVVLLPSLSGNSETVQHETAAAADKILRSVGQPYQIAPESPGEESIIHLCSCSIGVTFFAADETNQLEIMKRADKAMYAAKHEGRHRVCFFRDTAPAEHMA